MKNILGLLGFAVILGCAGEPKKPVCATVEQEPVSNCRAEEKCIGKKVSTYEVGSGLGVGADHGLGMQTQSTRAYAACLSEDLAAQRMLQQSQPTKK